MQDKKIFLGIDPGYATCGFGVISVENKNIRVEGFGVMTTPSSLPFAQRLWELEKDFLALLEKFSPECVILEKIFWGANVDNALLVAHARGVLECVCARKNIPTLSFSPTEVKSRLVGHGKAPKFQVQNVLKLRLGLEKIPTPDDAADALALALLGAETKK